MSRSSVVSSIVFGLFFSLVTAIPAAAQQPTQTCLYAFSKDMCGARLFGGNWGVPACGGPVGPNCSNLIGVGANFRGPWASSAGTCGDLVQVPCDEAPDFGGTFWASVDVRSQRHTNCKARGSYDGGFRILDANGNPIAGGDLVATLGMGTHRDTCNGACDTGVCERCHDARVIDNQFNWQVGSEGTLRGEVVAGPYAGCRFTASYQGNFTTDGDSRGPLAPNASWGFCGSIEGVLECSC